MITKTFKYTISVDAIPFDYETGQRLFNGYNPDFPQSVFADEIIEGVFIDAIQHCRHIIAIATNKELIPILEAKIKTYTLMMESIAKIE